MPKRRDITKPSDARKLGRDLMREIKRGAQRESARGRPVGIPFQAVTNEDLSLTDQSMQPNQKPDQVFNFYGEISNSSVAAGNETVNLNHSMPKTPADARLEAAITRLLEHIPRDQITADEAEGLRADGEQILDELRTSAPDQSKMAKTVQSIQQTLKIIATGAQQGAAVGAHAWAKEGIESLPLP